MIITPNNPTFVPAKDWDHSDDKPCRPGERDGGDCGLRGAVPTVVVGVPDGVESLKGDDEETEDGDLSENDDAGVDDEAADEVRWEAVEGCDDAWDACNGDTEDGGDSDEGVGV